jgi:hypothetical protein
MTPQTRLHLRPSADFSSPSGFTIWGQAILGNTPCASLLSTSYPMPSSVYDLITSEAGATATFSAGAAVATQSVEIIANIVSAALLPFLDSSSFELSQRRHWNR